MGTERGLSELRHAAEHRDGSAGGALLLQEAERCGDALGICGVGVVDDHKSAGGGAPLKTARRRLPARQSERCLLLRDAQRKRTGNRQRCICAEDPVGGPACGQELCCAGRFDLYDFAGKRSCREQRERLCLRHEELLALDHLGEQLHLLFRDALATSEALEVSGADIGPNAHRRPHHPLQPLHLAGLRNAAFDDRDIGARVETEQRLGDADLRVVAERRARHTERVGESADQHLFGGGLAVAAGDRDDRAGESAPCDGRERLNRRGGVCHDHEDVIGTVHSRELAAERDGSARIERGAHEGIAVSLRLERDKEVSLTHAAPRVDNGAFAASLTVADQFTASPGSNLRRCRGPNHGLELSARSNFRRTKGEERTRSSASSAWPTA